jgi:hypothetical protein
MAESINQRTAYVPDQLNANELRALLGAILADLAAIKAAVNTHTHSGVTVGAGTSGAPNANTVGTLSLTA